MSFAYHRDTPILDTNVAQVLSRYFGRDQPAGGGTPALWATAQAVIPKGEGPPGQPGIDGPGGDGLHRARTALRGLPGATRLRLSDGVSQGLAAAIC